MQGETVRCCCECDCQIRVWIVSGYYFTRLKPLAEAQIVMPYPIHLRKILKKVWLDFWR